MNFMKRLGLAVLVLILGALCAASPALAGKWPKPVSYTYELTPPEIDPAEPEALGQYTLTVQTSAQLAGAERGVEVTCKNLTPRKQYFVMVYVWWYKVYGEYADSWYESGYSTSCHAFTTDKNGRLHGEFTVGAGVCIEDLWIENDAGRVVLETEP